MSDAINDGWGSIQIPYSQEAEEACLGGILLNPMAYLDVATLLKADDFYILRHKYIWEAYERISGRGEPIDYLTVTNELGVLGTLNEVGGPAYLSHLSNSTPTSTHVEIYARLIERTATRRRLMVAADHIKGLALNEELTIEQVKVEAYWKLDDAIPENRERTLVGVDSIEHYDSYLAELQAQKASGQMVAYPLPPQWTKLRELIPNFYPGDFIVVSGPPGSGKSSFLEEWAEYCAQLGLWTKYSHTEMSTEQILHRRMARHSGLPFDFLASGDALSNKMTPLQSKLMQKADGEIANFAKRLIYSWAPDVQWKRLATQMRRDAIAGVKVFFIDHFQDIQIDSGKNSNVVRDYENACMWLAAFAEFRRVTVIVASQENKSGGTKWSTKLLEKALTRISIKRATLTNEQTYVLNGITYKAMPGEADPFADVIVGKARFGKRGKSRMLNHGPEFRWLDTTRRNTKPLVEPTYFERDSAVLQ